MKGFSYILHGGCIVFGMALLNCQLSINISKRLVALLADISFISACYTIPYSS